MNRVPAHRGYSLPELLVVLAIVAVIGSVVVSGYRAVRLVGDARHAGFIVSDALHEAQNRALNEEYDSAWGETIAGGNVVVFSGATYATRTSSRDHTYPLPSSITAAGTTEVDFAKFTGVPAAAATTTLSNAYGTSTVTVSTGGAISHMP